MSGRDEITFSFLCRNGRSCKMRTSRKSKAQK
jgi:hypothetical protein